MEDSETEAAETEPLVRQSGTTPAAAPITGGGTGTATRSEGRQVGRGHTLGRPRLSLVPETSEKSVEDDNGQVHTDRNGRDTSPSRRLETPTRVCPFFGVKNYLHHFYEKQDINNAAIYEDYRPQGGDQVLLVRQGEGRCSSSVFRLSLVLGGLLLLLGAIAFIIAAFAARATVIASQEGHEVSDEDLAQQAQVDALLLVGLVAATLGSTTLAAALVSRTFCSRTEEAPYPFQFSQYPLEPPLSPSDKKVPATQCVTQVQPSPALIPYP
ncbi:hypothetical protein Pmani_032565 [Petrolisthes manimaculis]|uniref:Uncharacterized protein n=1 Tax=Petrolisthes manimaculis TaxID=1843537 RepID=A0AAE1TRC4_9EUCA|nr:hypothetical protein Pmani_032565 [Petrolisthes manimaculis]